MQLTRILVGGLAGMLCVLPVTAYGQENTEPGDPSQSASRHIGPLALTPTLSLTSFGWDSNVFLRGNEPVGDFTTTIRPDVQAWLKLGRARVKVQSALNFAYFRDHPTERSVDSAHEGRLDLPLARVVPYVSASWLSARQRFGFEIDERVRRHQESARGGVIVRLGSRTNIDVAAQRNRLRFDSASGLRDLFLTDFYDYTSHGMNVTVRRDLTPLTSVAVTLDKHQDRFDFAPRRDSNSFSIASGLEFKPFALITGHAFVGWSRTRLIEPGGPSFRGAVASIDLSYVFLGATRFGVQAERSLSYSAIHGQHAFLLSGVNGSVTHRLTNAWDIGGRLGRYRTSYGYFDLSDEPAAAGAILAADRNHEIVTAYGGDVGYRAASNIRIAFGLGRMSRYSTVGAGRHYDATRAMMSITYEF